MRLTNLLCFVNKEVAPNEYDTKCRFTHLGREEMMVARKIVRKQKNLNERINND
jgi:hypothetical protein